MSEVEVQFLKNTDALPKTIQECHLVILFLGAQIQEQGSKIQDLESITQKAEIDKQSLKIEIQNLKERLLLNSQNSSLPPSLDFHKKHKKKKEVENKVPEAAAENTQKKNNWRATWPSRTLQKDALS